MFEDLINKPKTEPYDGPKKVSKRINLKGGYDKTVCIEFLEDLQEVLWDLEQAPCFHCGAEAGTNHKNTCLYLQVLKELDHQLSN